MTDEDLAQYSAVFPRAATASSVTVAEAIQNLCAANARFPSVADLCAPPTAAPQEEA